MDILLIFLILIELILISIFLYRVCQQHFPTIITAFGGASSLLKTKSRGPQNSPKDVLNLPKDILNVFLDERNFYYATKDMGKLKTTTSPLSLLKQYLHKQYPKKRIKMHIITKNSNMVDYIDELDEYENRYDWGEDTLYIANTTYDTEIISQTSKNHHLRGRDDFLALLLALEHLDNNENILIISNDKMRDVDKMYEMPEFNMIKIYKDSIDKRHINPSKYKSLVARFKKLINNSNQKIDIPILTS
jgi:hypothetical protein